jgi:hypothetical protein
MRLGGKALPRPQDADPVAPKVDVGNHAATDALAIHPLFEVFSAIAKSIDTNLKRIAETLDPPDDARPVGTPYVAKRLGQTTTWVAEMARRGKIPKSCIAAGTGVGKPWKFHRDKIDAWIENR